MNSFVNAIATELLKGKPVQDYEIDIIANNLVGQVFRFKSPLRMRFSNGDEMDITMAILRDWLRVYKETPTVCRNRKEYEDKLLAMRI